MDPQNLVYFKEGRRPLAFSTAHAVSSKPIMMSNNEIAQQKPSILMGRFKALLREREDEFRASSNDDVPVPPLTTEEIVQIYALLLADLTCNLKPIITDLTIIAELQAEHARGIADAICNRILEAPADQKLPSLYLLDSIVKNVGQGYVRYFSPCLPEVFCEAYRQVHPKLHNAMRHLFGTWSSVFPPSVLHKIEAQLPFPQTINNSSSITNSLRAPESPQATHGIHVNPKYLQQLEQSTMDSVGSEKLESKVSVGLTSFGLGASKMHQPLTNRFGRSSPSRIGLDMPFSASVDEYGVENSTNRIVEREPLSHPALDYGVGKALGRGEGLSGRQRTQYSDGRNRSQNSMTYSLSNEHQRQSLRALIDAYGSDKSNENSSNNPLLVERQDTNGIDKLVSKSWQNIEEEEFNWEDMSPTLVDNRRNNDFLTSTVGFSKEGPIIGVATSDQDTGRRWPSRSQLPPLDDSFVSSSYGRGSPLQVSELQNQSSQILSSRHPRDARKSSQHSLNSSQQLFNIGGRATNLKMPRVSSIPNTDVKQYGTKPTLSIIGSGLESNVEAHPPVLPVSFGMRPRFNVHAARPPISNPMFPLERHGRSQFEATTVSSVSAVNHGQNRSLLMPEQSLDIVENKTSGLSKLHQLPNQLAGKISFNQQNLGQAPQLQLFPSQDLREKLPVAQAPSALQFSHGIPLQGHPGAGGALISLPPVLPPAMSLTVPRPNAGPIVSNQQQGGAFSGLIDSLMAQGLISLTNQPLGQDSVGTEFNPDVLKIRHKSAISALYDDLPRQCTTCGLRFKCQEEHSNHMDWHVTKNRMSKNRKQNPSRKWFVSGRMWLSGAEALGTEPVPGFLPTEVIEEKKNDEELDVPADEDQNTCALCGEPFEEFYSDEAEEWMYRGAMYLNAPKGTTAGLDRSQFGPIVHAKCRSESTVVPYEDYALDESANDEEGCQRKRLKS